MASLLIQKFSWLYQPFSSLQFTNVLQNEFKSEYGTFDVSIQNGTINYPEENGEADKKD